MAVDEPNVIDFVAESRDSAVSLVISDHLEWDDSVHHQEILQDKLNAYIRFFESGEMYTQFPSTRDQWPTIDIRFFHEPDEDGAAFLSKAAETLESRGLKLTHCLQIESASH